MYRTVIKSPMIFEMLVTVVNELPKSLSGISSETYNQRALKSIVSIWTWFYVSYLRSVKVWCIIGCCFYWRLCRWNWIYRTPWCRTDPMCWCWWCLKGIKIIYMKKFVFCIILSHNPSPLKSSNDAINYCFQCANKSQWNHKIFTIIKWKWGNNEQNET